MQVIPPTLFFAVPVFSMILLYIRVSTQFTPRSSNPESRDKFSRPLVSYFAFLSFGVFTVIAGSLGLAACILKSRGAGYTSLDAGEHVIVALIKYECKCFNTSALSSLMQNFSGNIGYIHIFDNHSLQCCFLLQSALVQYHIKPSPRLRCVQYYYIVSPDADLYLQPP